MVSVIEGLVDSHCHLDLEPLGTLRHKICAEAEAAGVRTFVVPGVHPSGWSNISAVAAENQAVLPAYGIHPMHAGCVDDLLLEQLQVLAGTAAAIGETGLDPAYQVSLECQEVAFREQLRIALACGRPLLIHCRSVFQRALQLLRDEKSQQVGGIMHGFSGSVEMAREFIKLGFAISISGSVTWVNAVKPLKLATQLPLEWLVLETDAPDMTPQRYRGRFNRPAWLTETAQTVAALRGVPVDTVARQTSATAERVLRRSAAVT